MDFIQYKTIGKNFAVNNNQQEKIPNIILWRQLLICSLVWTTYFTLGLSVGAPTVFIPQLRREANSTDAVSDEMASWLSSVTGYAGIPWVFIMPIFTHYTGRKKPFMLLYFFSLASFVAFYWSTNNFHLLFSEILQGMVLTCHATVSPILITEYTSPRYRGVFLTMKSASMYWGMWVSNAIGTFFYWKNIALVAFISLIHCFTVFLWPESPYWLSSKGRFDECAKAHRWLKGSNRDSERELEDLINSQKDYLRRKKDQKTNISMDEIIHYVKTFLCKEFYMPIVLCFGIMGLYHLSGKMACSMYAIEIIKEMTDSESTAYKGMLILDGVTLLGMYVGCAVCKILRRRTLLLVSSSVGICFLFILSLYQYLITVSIITEIKVVSLILLAMFSLTISCGPMILSTSIYGELISTRFKTSSMIVMGLFTDAIMATVLKVSPYIFKTFKLHGAFLFYGVGAGICTIFLYIYLPETKDRTLQDIESYFKESPKVKGAEAERLS